MLKEIPLPESKYSDEKSDRRLALKVLLIVGICFFVLGFGCGLAHAEEKTGMLVHFIKTR